MFIILTHLGELTFIIVFTMITYVILFVFYPCVILLVFWYFLSADDECEENDEAMEVEYIGRAISMEVGNPNDTNEE